MRSGAKGAGADEAEYEEMPRRGGDGSVKLGRRAGCHGSFIGGRMGSGDGTRTRAGTDALSPGEKSPNPPSPKDGGGIGTM
jgi:hypothetical protein